MIALPRSSVARSLFATALCALLTVASNAHATAPAPFTWPADLGNGSYQNPILWADYPDPDVIRVGDTYYMVSTSMHLMPGCPILRSPDLVNWTFAGYAVPDFKEHPFYDLDGGQRYGRGPWACTLRYHGGKFYVGFNTNHEGFFLCVADRVEGPWTRTRFDHKMHDPGLLFDDDGRIYVAHGKNEALMVTELKPDATGVLGPDRVVFSAPKEWNTFEGSHFYKFGDTYYIFNTWGGKKGKQAVLRSKNVFGPYESRLILDDDGHFPDYFTYGLHQGGIVQTAGGEWWFIIFQDRDAVGRVPHLLPVTWRDGWPELGVHGRTVAQYPKPAVGPQATITMPATSDDFDAPTLGLQWQWNHNPDPAGWSLTAAPGRLRLTTTKVVKNILEARNTLTQRVQGPGSAATVRLTAADLRDGDTAGLAVFQAQYGYIALTRDGGATALVMVNQGREIARVPDVAAGELWLRAAADCVADRATFAYSRDGRTYTPLGDSVPLAFKLSHFVGNRFALFNFSTQTTGGHADFDDFIFFFENPGYALIDPARIEAEHFITAQGATIMPCDDAAGGYAVTLDGAGAALRLPARDFPAGATTIQLRVHAATLVTLELRLDEAATPAATVTIPATGETWQTISVPVAVLSGRHTLSLQLATSGSVSLNWVLADDSPTKL